MRTIGNSRVVYSAMLRFASRLTSQWEGTLERINGVLLQSSVSRDGVLIIPPSNERGVVNAVGSIIQREFVGADLRHAFAADGVTPLAPYPRLLNEELALVTMQAVIPHTKYMDRYVPSDVAAWLRSRSLQEQVRSNPLATYDAPHTWVDPRGYRLSDRIWQASAETRRRIDALLTDGIRTGRGSQAMARDLEQFLLPNRANLRTTKPYGTDASRDAMRLARSEITRAHSTASLTAGQANPFTDGMDWALSARHPKIDICDRLATIGMDGQRIREPYPITGNVPTPVVSSHPNCCLPGQLVTTLRGDVPIEQVNIGDYVLTHRGRYKRVLNAWSSDYDDTIYSIATDNRRIQITKEHPVLTKRGWVNAERIKLLDQVLYTGGSAPVNRNLPVTECKPTLFKQTFIPFRVLDRVVPAPSITLDGDLVLNDGKVQIIAQYPILWDIRNTKLFESLCHFNFKRTRTLVEIPAFATTEYSPFDRIDWAPKHFATVKAHLRQMWASFASSHFLNYFWVMHRIVLRFVFRNLAPRFWLLGWVIVASSINLGHSFAHFIRILFGACAVILNPLISYCLAMGAAGDAEIIQHVHDHSELNTDNPGDVRRSKHLHDVKIGQQFLQWNAKLQFDTIGMVLNSSNPLTVASTGTTAAQLAANRAGITLWHDNLLSLSPDVEVGTASGNAVVSRVANPTQAQFKYTSIQSIVPSHYTGKVYNLHVDDDNSYTLNDIAVHNCLCTLRPVASTPPSEVVDRLRAELRAGEPPPVTPIDAFGFIRALLGTYLASLVSGRLLND